MRPTFAALILVASACSLPSDPGTDTETESGPDTELPAETDVVDTEDPGHDTLEPHTDSDSPVDTEPPGDTDTDTDPPVDTDPPADTDVVCRGELDQIGDVYGPPVRADVETLDDLDAWLCLDDPDRAATCPPAHQACQAPPGQALTAVFVRASTYVSQYALYDGAGQLVAYTVSSDAEEFCDYRDDRLWLGDIPYGGTCADITNFGFQPQPCRSPLLCTSTP